MYILEILIVLLFLGVVYVSVLAVALKKALGSSTKRVIALDTLARLTLGAEQDFRFVAAVMNPISSNQFNELFQNNVNALAVMRKGTDWTIRSSTSGTHISDLYLTLSNSKTDTSIHLAFGSIPVEYAEIIDQTYDKESWCCLIKTIANSAHKSFIAYDKEKPAV